MIVKSPNLKGVSSLDRILETHDSYIHFVDNNIFFEPKEGMNLSFSREIDLLIKAADRIGNLPFAYISNHCKHAAAFLYDYKYLEMIPNLIGIAIVRQNASVKGKIIFDEASFKNPIEIFESLIDAKKWSIALFSE